MPDQSTVKILAKPHLRVRDAVSAIKFYEEAFGAVETERLSLPDGGVVRAELKIGDAPFSVGEESPETGSPSPVTLGGSTVTIDLVVPDVDAVVEKAVAAGAIVQYPVADQFYGWRQGRLLDPFGHMWSVGTQTEVITPAEMQRRFDAFLRSATES